MGMSPVMRGEGERRKSLWPKLSGGSGNGRGVESGDKGEADGMTTDRSSLSMRSVFMYELRGETSRGECKEVSIYFLRTRSFTDADLGFGISQIRNFSADSSGHACNTCTCTTGQARFPGPTAVSHVPPNCQNCKSPGAPQPPWLPRNSIIALSRTGNRHGKMDEKTLSAFVAATVEKYNSYRHVSV